MTIATGAAGFVERAIEVAAHTGTTSFGPIPLTLSCEREEDWHDIDRRLAGTRPAWRPLHVVTVTSSSLPIGLFPPELAPAGDTFRVARDGDALVLSSGTEQMVWVLDAGRDLAIRWAVSGDVVPWERISPLQHGARWWASRNGGALVHCGAVAGDGGAVLLVGPAGAGKSTSTLACLGAGLDVLGDDYCFVTAPGAAAPAVVGQAYRYAKLDERALGLLPHLRERVAGPALRGKSLVEMDALEPVGRPVRAICSVVQVADGPTRVVPASKQRVLLAVAPSSMFQVRLHERPTLEVVSATVRSAVCARLEVSDPAAIPDVLHSFLAEIDA